MSEWNSRPLGEICSFANGLWKGKEGPLTTAGVFRNTNFRPHGVLDDSDVAYLGVEQKQLEKRRLVTGDIIIEKSGGGPKQAVGRVALFDKSDGIYSFSNFTSVARVKNQSEVHPHYLLKFLDWCYVSGVTERMQSNSTGIRNLDFSAYKAIQVPLPPLEQQRRIVAVLDEAFAAITTSTANSQNNEAAASGLLNNLIDSILTAEPGRTVMTLADAADPTCTLSYGIVQPGGEVEGGLPIVRPIDLQQKVIGLDGLKRIDPALAGSYKRTTLKGGEILLCVRGTTGVLSIASDELAGANVTRGIVPVRFQPALIDRAFGYYLMRSGATQRQIRAGTYGTALMQINIGDLRMLKLEIPSLTRQAILSERLNRLSADVGDLHAIYVKKLAAYAQLRESLLRQAFSGEPLGAQLLAA